MRQVGSDVDGETVESDPALYADPQSPDLGLVWTLADPDSDAALRAVRIYAKATQSVDHPLFEGMNEAANVFSAPFEVEHHIADALPRPVIGVTPAAACFEHRKIQRVHQFRRISAGAGGEQGRMFEQPHAFAIGPGADRGRSLLHEGERVGISDGGVADAPFDIGGEGGWAGCPGAVRARLKVRISRRNDRGTR